MNPTENASSPLPDNFVFKTQLTAAFRGGAIMLAGAVLWGLALQQRHTPFFELCFIWLPSAWMIFPMGAFLGCFLPRWVARRGWLMAISVGVFVGTVAGLVLASGFWLCQSHNNLVGLVANHGGGGYASYSYSVRLQLQEQAWRAFTGVVPVTAVWVALWTVWINRAVRFSTPEPTPGQSSATIRLHLDPRLLRLVGWVAAGLPLFATALLLVTALAVRGAGITPESFLVVGPGAAGLVVLGPLLGPLLTGNSSAWTSTYVAVALPVLLGSLAPFGFCHRPVRPGTAVVAWCGFVTALFFWIAAGLFSLGRCVG